ncbi:flagellar basal body L-ring protein FlgH [Bowmanella sp. JS7-9]|uniref:Flagellar L-ring protein n=1 Tax=Pseudobowmanella zhangzhouensis TaxID=1537679 RepID=A0ABW1XKG2_9ALTE|nr:flagellar basal body L-ring protein FlgH [Bowmanella sp. JS7-9]TBX22591.1 flagellar L-ring protein FlgH [Bowmanella sp. JS7-9]
MRLVSLFCLVSLLAGCGSTQVRETLPNDPFYAPVIPDMPAQKISEDGSLFQPGHANSLFSDMKARRVGDLITVVLQETTSATKSASSALSKSNNVAVDPIIGLGGNAVNIGPESIQFGLGNSQDFSGDASTNQSNNLRGNISVTVVQVLPNDNLVVRGEKWLTLNNGDEYIRLTGIVRTADISPQNEVVSTKIANARIQYSGTGEFANAQQQGWLTQFFNSDWWPF